MTNLASAARAPIGKLLLCSLVLCGLCACGSDGASSNASPASSGTGSSLASPRLGVIDRSPTAATTTSTAAKTGGLPKVASTGSGKGAPQPPVKVTDGTITLDWTPPTQNSDGTSLTNLAGYTVYYGTSPGNLNQSVKVSNPGLTAFTVSNLAPGTWYFAITSYSSDGVESVRSGVVSTTI